MRIMLLLITIAGIVYMLSLWLQDYQTDVGTHDEAQSGFENGIVTPINEATDIKHMIEAQYQ